MYDLCVSDNRGTSKRVQLLDAVFPTQSEASWDVDETANIQFQHVQDYVLDLLSTKVLTIGSKLLRTTYFPDTGKSGSDKSTCEVQFQKESELFFLRWNSSS